MSGLGIRRLSKARVSANGKTDPLQGSTLNLVMVSRTESEISFFYYIICFDCTPPTHILSKYINQVSSIKIDPIMISIGPELISKQYKILVSLDNRKYSQ